MPVELITKTADELKAAAGNPESLMHPKPWILGGLLIGLVLFWAISATNQATPPLGIATGAWRWILLAGFPLVSLGVFHISREAYWRLGSAEKIAVAYKGYKVDPSEWQETRRALMRSASEGVFRGKVSLRLIPQEYTESEEAWKGFSRKYGFSFYLLVRDSRTTARETDISRGFKLGAITVPNRMRKQLIAAAAELWGRPLEEKDLLSLLEQKGNTLFEIVLIAVCINSYCKERGKEYLRLLEVLDERLSKRFQVRSPSRSFVRLLHCDILLDASRFTPKRAPTGAVLDEILQDTSYAHKRYKDEFAGVYLHHARVLFFAGRLDEALAISKDGLKKAVEHGIEVSEPGANLYLNIGVLSLFLGNWDNAASALGVACSEDYSRFIPWPSLVEFADVARKSHPSAVYLQFLYRLKSGQTISHGLEESALQWLTSDTSRSKLGKHIGCNFARKVAMLNPSVVTKPVPASTKGRKRGKQRKS